MAVAESFPDYPPYGGPHDEVVPHLTVGHGVDPAELRNAERQIAPDLPIKTTVAAVELWCGEDRRGSLSGGPPWVPVRWSYATGRFER
jgi:hypothetical protein